MITGKYNIIAPQGSTFKLKFTVTTDGIPWNFDTYVGRMQVRSATNNTTTILSLISPVDIVMTSSGVVTIVATADAMTAAPAGRWVYDFEVESTGGEVTRLLEGRFAITAEVTK